MTAQIIPVKCPYLNKHYQGVNSSPVCEVLLRCVDDVPVSIICNFAKLVNERGETLETITADEKARAERELPEGGTLLCDIYSSSRPCIYTSPWLRFRKDIDDNDLHK